jgi:hypothetical protein
MLLQDGGLPSWPPASAGPTATDPAAADPVNATLLKEYGFTDFAAATYTRMMDASSPSRPRV